MNRRSFFAMLPGAFVLSFSKPELQEIVYPQIIRFFPRSPDEVMISEKVLKVLMEDKFAKRITEIVGKAMERQP